MHGPNRDGRNRFGLCVHRKPTLLVKIAEAAFAAILTVVRDDPRVGKISWVEHQGISDGTWWLESMERMERFAQLLEDLMRALAPELMPEDVALVVYRRAMVGAISHVALMWSSLDSPERLEETASALARFVVAATTAKAP